LSNNFIKIHLKRIIPINKNNEGNIPKSGKIGSHGTGNNGNINGAINLEFSILHKKLIMLYNVVKIAIINDLYSICKYFIF
tara:strand:- start:170 stop:412 length:243 start_codon:yes stop_codon:yes gene_type:complete